VPGNTPAKNRSKSQHVTQRIENEKEAVGMKQVVAPNNN
jgi:hypothetical protein